MNNIFKATNSPSHSINFNSPTTMDYNIDTQQKRGFDSKPPKKKLDFKTMKNNTISSLNDVEYFLNNFSKISHYMKLFKFFR